MPPDLRVLCRKLTSLEPTQLPHSLPILVRHVVRCRQPLSTPLDSKAKGEAAEVSMLVHKFKASLTTLLESRTREARFVAIALIKAAVDVGGWEVLKDCGPWVRGLLSIVTKGDPAASKELAIVALTRVYTLLQPYQTLVREIATPNIPTFAKACLELLKSSSPSQMATASPNISETICDSFTTLIPLYPATFRPFSTQTMAALRPYLAPTDSDSIIVPASLSISARRLAATQHFVAAKSGGSDEWAKLVGGIIDELHATVSQVFRAIEESWEPTAGVAQTEVNMDHTYPSGGSAKDQLPPWEGVQAGSQRITGLLGYLAACLDHNSKGPVALHLTKITDAITRVCLVARLSPKSQTWDQALQTRARIGREEKEELWSVIPDIHIAALQLTQTLFQRLEQDMLPYASELLDHVSRVTKSGMDVPAVRATTYSLLNDILHAAGPTLSKSMVDMVGPIIGAACRDLQEDAGHFKPPKKAQMPAESKKNGATTNTDLFLKKADTATEAQPILLEIEHKNAASSLLATLLSQVPQQHLKPSHRSLLDQTAILMHNRDAMLASVLNPYTDSRGRKFASILPHLTQLFPEDQGVEILRTNLRPEGGKVADDEQNLSDQEDEEEDEDEAMVDSLPTGNDNVEEDMEDTLRPGVIPAAPKVDLPVQINPFESQPTETATVYGGLGDARPREGSPPKRKHDAVEDVPQKRQETRSSAPSRAPEATTGTSAPPADGEDSDSDESVHLNMELEDDDDDGEN